MEIRRHNANDFGIAAIESNLLIQDTWVATEAALPQRKAQHGDTRGAFWIELLRFGEGAADEGRSAECVKQAGSRSSAANTLGLAVSGQIEIGNNACDGEIGENLLALPPVEVVGSSCRGFRNDGVRQAGGEGNEAARVRIGKVTDENAIGDGKDAGGRRASKA